MIDLSCLAPSLSLRFRMRLSYRSRTAFILLGWLTVSAPACSQPVETWWQNTASDNSTITINSAEPVALRQFYGLRISSARFCGVQVTEFMGQTVYGIRGAVTGGKLVVDASVPIDEQSRRSATDPSVLRLIAGIERNRAPTELFVSPTSLVERNQPPQRLRSLLALFAPLDHARKQYVAYIDGYCSNP
jgi:hypothetical protein